MAKGKSTERSASASSQSSGQQKPAAGARPVASARPPNQSRKTTGRRYQQLPWWRKSGTLISGVVVLVLVIVAIFIFVARSSHSNTGAASGGSEQIAPAAVVQAVTQVSPQVISAVKTGGQTDPLVATPKTALLTGPSGKPEFLYIGAEYCPFCAAERWSVIVALSRFGTFSNLHLTTSSSTDVYPDTPTFTFYGSHYSSPYIDFVSVEQTTRDPNTPLQTPTAQEQQLLAEYDAPPYTQNAGGIPFLDIANQYVASGAGYSPQLLAGLSQQDVAARLRNPNDPVTQAIVGNANYLTAAICRITNNQPGNVCTAGPIPQIEQQLPKGQ
jgi:thiol-disulfide isomerase/thioredoxin